MEASWWDRLTVRGPQQEWGHWKFPLASHSWSSPLILPSSPYNTGLGSPEAKQLPGKECYPTLQQIIGLSFTEQSPDHQFSSVQSLSPVWLLATTWTEACQASLSITNSKSLLTLMSIKFVMPSNHLILCHPLLLLPSIFPSITFFQWVSSSHQMAKVLELQLQHQSF